MKRSEQAHDTRRLFPYFVLASVMLIALLSTAAVAAGMTDMGSKALALPAKRAVMPQGNFTATPTCQPGAICATATETRCPQLPCDPGPSATATECPNPAVGCPSATATVCVDNTGQGLCPSPTATCQPGTICSTATSTPTCEPGHCVTQTPTATVCAGANGQCASPTPTCDAGIPCPTNTKTATATATECVGSNGQGCATASSTATTKPSNTATPRPSFTATATNEVMNTSTPTATVTCVTAPSGMTHWWPLDELTGNVANESVFGGNAIEINGPAHVPGKVAGGLNFNGVNQWAAVVPPWNSPQLGTGDFTIDTWISIPAASLVGTQVFLDGRNFAPIGYEMFLYNGRLGLQMADGLPPPSGYSNYIAPSAGALATPGWHFVAATVKRATGGGTLWVDGAAVLTFNPRLGNLSNKAPLWIGRHHPNAAFNQTLYFRGSLDEIEFFRRALTPAEVISIFEAGTRGKCKKEPTPPTPTNTPGPCHWCQKDVPNGSPFYPYVTNLAYEGVIGGYPCGGPGEPCGADNYPYYRPNANITRGQIAKLVALSAGFNDTPGSQTFADVPKSHTFWLWIEQLSSRGLISGYPCGGDDEPCDASSRPYYRSNKNATRGQLSKIVANAAGIDEDPGGQIFEDVPPEHTFYRYINDLARRGVVSGYECGASGEPCGPGNMPYFRSGNNVTRGQAAKIVANTFWLDGWLEP